MRREARSHASFSTTLLTAIGFACLPALAGQLEPLGAQKQAAVGPASLSSSLVQVVSAAEPLAFAQGRGFRVHDGRIQVYIRCASSEAAQQVVSLLFRDGADAILQREVFVQAWATPETIEAVASLPGVVRVERPIYAVKPPGPERRGADEPEPSLLAGSSVTEGLAAMNGPAWHSAGATGQGVSVGIIDSFHGYETLLGTELPPASRVEFLKIGGGARDTSPHGTACAEIVYDVAPNLEKMYLIEANTSLEVQQAIETLQARGVRVISASFGWPGVTPMDGTGFMQGTLGSFTGAGGLWVQSAGNYRNVNLWLSLADSDADGWTDFGSSGPDEINEIVRDTGSSVNYPVGEEIDVRLSWNQWSSPQTDLDLYLYYYDPNEAKWVKVAESVDAQNGQAGQYPYESISFTTEKAGRYGMAVWRSGGPANVQMHIWLGAVYSNYWLEYRTPSMSLGYPADDANAFSVAAVHSAPSYALESYSSAGPTAGPGGAIGGGRKKPDISGYANVATSSYGTTNPFNGTSAAAPHVTGAALLVRSVNPGWSPSQVRSFLEGRAIDQGQVGPDNDFGYGRLWLGAPIAGSTAPVAGFSYSPLNPLVNQTVSFTDSSSGGPTAWLWNFGDGKSSTARNPTHVFTASGVFAVTLTATNAAGSSSRTMNVSVSQVGAPVITYFAANPPAVSPGQQAILTWTSTGGTFATIDQGIGSVPTSGNVAIQPTIGVPYRLTVTGPGGSASASVTIAAVQSGWAGTWILPSSARVSGTNAFWTTDLVLLNTGNQTANVNVKFLGHAGSGAAGPEHTVQIPPNVTLSFPDVLSSLYGRGSDWGPILIRSSVPTLSIQGQTWTASPAGGSYGQSVPALSTAEAVGASPRGLAGLRQDAKFRTNLVLANMGESVAAVALRILNTSGATAATRSLSIPALGFLQLNLANDLGVSNFSGGSAVVSCSTPGCLVVAYASVIDEATADPRTVLAR
ncbi:MAG TPA: S8 family serine peptidase [Thermoanaerobaculia bacterium]|nr:S8 family serine peptidase [Thermoanaerobaculia bacterium]